MSKMTLEEIKVARSALEVKLLTEFQEFLDTTGVGISGVHLTRGFAIAGRTKLLDVNVDITFD